VVCDCVWSLWYMCGRCMQMFNSLKLTAYDLSVDMLDVHAVSIENRLLLAYSTFLFVYFISLRPPVCHHNVCSVITARNLTSVKRDD